jgi:hypothetical protein
MLPLAVAISRGIVPLSRCAALLLPVIGYMLGWPLCLLAWLPLQGPLVVLRAASTSVDGSLLHAVLASAFWCSLAFTVALHRYRNGIVAE